ncbi:MAG: ParB/RepB/Spo0J family partition protein [Gemmatimonadota bacterium]
MPAKKRGLPTRVKMRHDTHFVEELTTRHDVPVGRMVPVASVEPDPNQPRAAMGNLEDLVSSIRERGVLEPILVRRLERKEGTEEGKGDTYRIISGERRYRAAQQAGLYELPVIEMDVTEQEALEIALIENLQRKDLTPFEEADGYKALAERHGYTHEEISEAVGKSRTVITEGVPNVATSEGKRTKTSAVERAASRSADRVARRSPAVATSSVGRKERTLVSSPSIARSSRSARLPPDRSTTATVNGRL